MNRMPGGVNIGDGAARLRASRIRPFTRAAWELESPVRRQIDARFHLSRALHHLMNFCTPGDCFSLAHPYFTAFCAACLRYAVLTMTCVWCPGRGEISVGVVTPRVCVSRLKTHLVLVTAVFALGEHHGLVLLTDLDAELL